MKKKSLKKEGGHNDGASSSKGFKPLFQSGMSLSEFKSKLEEAKSGNNPEIEWMTLDEIKKELIKTNSMSQNKK